MRWRFICLVWILFLGWLPSLPGQSLKVAPAPAWVLPRAIGSASVTAFDGPVTYLLVDRQDSFVGTLPHSYFRLAGRINNTAGLDDFSQITAAFDPSCESLIVHDIQIRRGQSVLQLSLKPADFSLLQGEAADDPRMVDGAVTASYLLHDLRVGDIVEYAYSVVGQQPRLGKKWSGRHELNWNVPVLEAYIRQIWPADANVHWAVSRPDIGIQESIEGKQLIIQWTGRKLLPLLEEDQVPAWIEPMDSFSFSTWQSWEELVQWALPFYKINAASEQALEGLAASIRTKVHDQKAQVEEAIRFVQDEIRYVGIEVGAGSFIPEQPAQVLQRRYGDCKDKALVLTGLIRKLGYEAFPILVKAEGGQGLEKLPASPLVFNHVVVGVRQPDTEALYWVDATLTQQGLTLEARDYPLVYQGLPLFEGAKDLLLQDTRLTPKGRIEFHESYASEDFSTPTSLRISSRSFAWQAEKMRSELAAKGSTEVSDSLANAVKKMYPSATMRQEPVFQDDRAGNIVSVEQIYDIPDFWIDQGDGSYEVAVKAQATIDQALTQPQKVKRKHPLLLPYPLEILHQQEFRIAADWSVPETEEEIENSSFHYRLRQSSAGTTLRFIHEWESRQDQVTVEQLPRYLRDAEDVRQELIRSIHYEPQGPLPFWQRIALASPQVLGLFILFLTAIGWQLQGGDTSAEGLAWPRRSMPFLLALLLASSGAYALFWYADADRRLRRRGLRIMQSAWLWLSIASFAAALASRVLQLLIDPETWKSLPLPMLAVAILLHSALALATLRLLRREFPGLGWRFWPAWIFGPLYFQGKLQHASTQEPTVALSSNDRPGSDPELLHERKNRVVFRPCLADSSTVSCDAASSPDDSEGTESDDARK